MKIAIIGSASDHGYKEEEESTAQALGRELAERGHVVLYGPELTMPSLSYNVAKSAIEAGGTTIGISIGSARTSIYDPSAATYIIYTDASGGAGREVVLMNSADAAISIGGGAGTLTEMSIAYMNYIPVVALKESGGWSSKLAGHFVDAREKYKVGSATNCTEAVNLAEQMYVDLKGVPSHFDKVPG